MSLWTSLAPDVPQHQTGTGTGTQQNREPKLSCVLDKGTKHPRIEKRKKGLVFDICIVKDVRKL